MLTRDRTRPPRMIGQSNRQRTIIRFLASVLVVVALAALLLYAIKLIDTDV